MWLASFSSSSVSARPAGFFGLHEMGQRNSRGAEVLLENGVQFLAIEDFLLEQGLGNVLETDDEENEATSIADLELKDAGSLKEGWATS